MKNLLAASAVCACVVPMTRAQAQDVDFGWLACFGSPTTPTVKVNWRPDQYRVVAIPGAGYSAETCWHHAVEFTIPKEMATAVYDSPYSPQHSPSRVFSFDSRSSELIDTAAKCNSYQQSTLVLKKKLLTTGWSVQGFSWIGGTWVNGKCTFYVMPGSDDFRAKTYSPIPSNSPFAGETYRVFSRATTGTTPAVPRMMCVGAMLAGLTGNPRSACTQ